MSTPKVMERVLKDATLPIVEKQGVACVYHLATSAAQLSPNILIVGDPERVPIIAKQYLDVVEADVDHRGLRTITGTTKEINGQKARITITTSGMGQPSLEIVLNEIVACNEIDLATKKQKPEWGQINIIRVGTSGALQVGTELGTPIISEYAIGMDNTGLFYDFPFQNEKTKKLEEDMVKLVRDKVTSSRFKTAIHPYASQSNPEVVKALEQTAKEQEIESKKGITVSCSGFFANQGRDMSRASMSFPEIDDVIASSIRVDDILPENMEMETSFLLHYMGGLGYRAGAVCATIAHRPTSTFAKDLTAPVKKAIALGVGALVILANKK